MISIIRKTIDEIKKAERQAAKVLLETDKKKDHLMADARESIVAMQEKQKHDIAGLRESKVEQARSKAKDDAAALLKTGLAKIDRKDEAMQKNLPKAVDLIMKEFKKAVQ